MDEAIIRSVLLLVSCIVILVPLAGAILYLIVEYVRAARLRHRMENDLKWLQRHYAVEPYNKKEQR